MNREEQTLNPPNAPITRPIKFKALESSKSQHQGANASLMRHHGGEEGRAKGPSVKVSVLKFLSGQKQKSESKIAEP